MNQLICVNELKKKLMAFFFLVPQELCMFVERTYLSGQSSKVTLPSDTHRPQNLTPISERLAGEAGALLRELQRKGGRETFASAIGGPVSLCRSRKASKIYFIFFSRVAQLCEKAEHHHRKGV